MKRMNSSINRSAQRLFSTLETSSPCPSELTQLFPGSTLQSSRLMLCGPSAVLPSLVSRSLPDEHSTQVKWRQPRHRSSAVYQMRLFLQRRRLLSRSWSLKAVAVGANDAAAAAILQRQGRGYLVKARQVLEPPECQQQKQQNFSSYGRSPACVNEDVMSRQ